MNWSFYLTSVTIGFGAAGKLANHFHYYLQDKELSKYFYLFFFNTIFLKYCDTINTFIAFLDFWLQFLHIKNGNVTWKLLRSEIHSLNFFLESLFKGVNEHIPDHVHRTL